MSLLESLTLELNAFDKSSTNLESLIHELEDLLSELRQMEAALEQEVATNIPSPKKPDLTAAASKWYKSSISGLKSYNTAINKFNKNIINNPRFNVNIDDAYLYPLTLANYPLLPPAIATPEYQNKLELTKAITLHLLKNGHCEVISDLLEELTPGGPDNQIDQGALVEFSLLKQIIDAVIKDHDLSYALAWFKGHQSTTDSTQRVEFKFHVLQYVLLLNNSKQSAITNATLAYTYSKQHFTPFSKRYFNEIAMLTTLLTFDHLDTQSTFFTYLQKSHAHRLTLLLLPEALFVVNLLGYFHEIHLHEDVFTNLAHGFMLEFCKKVGLSEDSSLFQGVLAGFIYMPAFYKYNQIQLKLGKTEAVDGKYIKGEEKVASNNNELPFQLADIPRFLWRYHPIFICPISRDQLVAVTSEDGQAGQANPVVVFDHCQHVALRESVFQLLKKGADSFKCHYCYKKHKMSEVKDAYFIDL